MSFANIFKEKKVTTQMVVDWFIDFAAKYGELPKDWPILVAMIDDSEKVQRQLLGKLLSRKAMILSSQYNTDPEAILYGNALADMGVQKIVRR